MTKRIIRITGLVLLLAGISLSVPHRKAYAWPCLDFVTGGGFFLPRFEGGPPARVNFGFNAGARSINNPDVKGHFNLVDHNDGTHISGVNVLSYQCLDTDRPLCRLFSGDAKVNGVPGFTYTVEVCDYGEPGRDDRIRVMVNGPEGFFYFADNSDSTKLCPAEAPSCGDLDGGNIQLHRKDDCPCAG